MQETIDITPTWSALIPIMVEVLKNPKANNSAKQEVVVELKRLAEIVDDQNAKHKAKKSKTMTQSEIRSMILNIVQGNLRWCDPTDRINLKKAEDLGIDCFTTQSAEEVLDDIITDLTSLQDELRIESSFQSAQL
jgi:hypothetical protein